MPIDLVSIGFESLSSLQYELKLFEADAERPHRFRALVVLFRGSYREGSEGNLDGVFMESILRAALHAWLVDALVLDLRELSYTWGNSIGEVLRTGKVLAGQEFPIAVVTCDDCRGALAGAASFYARGTEADGQDKWLFDDLAKALDYVQSLHSSQTSGTVAPVKRLMNRRFR